MNVFAFRLYPMYSHFSPDTSIEPFWEMGQIHLLGNSPLLAGASQWHLARSGQSSHGAPTKPGELSFD